jgi:EmrB/QacA subfamily drug resistance transporter
MQHASRKWILTATILGSSMAFIDGSVVNIALPVLQKSLSATITDAQWVVDAYALVLASLLLAGGALGDHLGRTRVFNAGVVIFAAASAWCGVAANAPLLIAARTLQGLGAAMFVPGSLAIITETFPAKERGKAIGTWSAMTSLGTIAGPVLGGWLIQAISWRAIFFINIPIAAATLLILMYARPAASHQGNARSIDWTGTLLITAALAALTYALIEAPAHRDRIGVSDFGAAAVSLIAFVVFIVHEKRAENAIVPPAMFRSRAFTAANVLTLLLYTALSSVMFLLPYNLIDLRGDSPLQAGAAFLPFVVTMSLLSRWSGALADRIGPRPLLIVGPLVAAVGCVLLALPNVGGSYWTTLFPGILVLAIGVAIMVAPLTTTVMTSIDDESEAGTASGINNAVARVAGLLAIALFGGISIIVFGRDLDRRLAGEPPAVRRAMAEQTLRLADAQPPKDAGEDTGRRVRSAINASFLHAFRLNMLVAAALAAGSAGAALAIRRPKRRAGIS